MATSHAGGKSAAAFRTISEVSGELDVPQHVLRFWETKFAQVRPLKRAGGRRYYRPEDIALLRRIRDLLYADGYTIKGVQRLLRDGQGKVPSDTSEQPESAAGAGAGRGPNGGSKAAPKPKATPAASLSEGKRRDLEALLRELQTIKGMLKDEG